MSTASEFGGKRPVGVGRTQRGAALMLFLLVLLVAASAFLIERVESSVYAEQKRLAKSTKALAAAKVALIAYAVQDTNRPGSLPCPDIDYDGQSALPEYSGPDCTSRLGWFPYQTLDMQELRDDSGAKLWYAIANEYRANLPAGVPLNSETSGTLSVDGGGTTDVVAVILSPGAAFNAQSRPGENDGHAAAADRSQFLEDVNADANLDDYVSSAAGDFNDRLMIITRAELMREVEKRVVGELLGSLQAFKTANGVFPWPVPFTDPRTKTNFRGVPGGSSEGLLPIHVGDDLTGGFPTVFTVDWSNVAGAGVISQSGTVTASDLTEGLAGGVTVDDPGTACVWNAAAKTTAAQCSGTKTVNLLALGPPYETYSPTGMPPFFPVIAWDRAYTFNLNVVNAAGSVATSAPTGTTPRTRSLTITADTFQDDPDPGAGSFWAITDTVTYDSDGVPGSPHAPVTDSPAGLGDLTTIASTVGDIAVSGINYYLDPQIELPSWFVTNDWHHLSYFAVSADYQGGGAGDCVGSVTCLSLEVAAGTTVATDVGIAVVSAGNALAGQDRVTPGATRAQYFEDLDLVTDLVGPTVSYRPRGDSANNDRVRILQAAAL